MIFVETGAGLGRRAQAYFSTPSTPTDAVRPYRRKAPHLLRGAPGFATVIAGHQVPGARLGAGDVGG